MRSFQQSEEEFGQLTTEDCWKSENIQKVSPPYDNIGVRNRTSPPLVESQKMNCTIIEEGDGEDISVIQEEDVAKVKDQIKFPSRKPSERVVRKVNDATSTRRVVVSKPVVQRMIVKHNEKANESRTVRVAKVDDKKQEETKTGRIVFRRPAGGGRVVVGRPLRSNPNS